MQLIPDGNVSIATEKRLPPRYTAGMTIWGEQTVEEGQLYVEALEGLGRVPYCAGVRCIEAVGVAVELQRTVDAEGLAAAVARDVRLRCLGCLEFSVEPLGTVYDPEDVDRILAEESTQ